MVSLYGLEGLECSVQGLRLRVQGLGFNRRARGRAQHLLWRCHQLLRERRPQPRFWAAAMV